jgi:prolyl oligopeptidase
MMQNCFSAPPFSSIEPVTELFHGVPVTDPYRWLEDQNSPQTRRWLEEQTRYASTYLDRIPMRRRIQKRIHELLAVETYDSVQKAHNRYFFRKRLPDQEQACVCMREGANGEDQLLLDPAALGTGPHTAVRPLRVSPDGRLLLYEIKAGGERIGRFEILDIERRAPLTDLLPRGYLFGFVFSPDSKSFYYVLDSFHAASPLYKAVYYHVLGSQFSEDREIFAAGEGNKLRLSLTSDANNLALLVYSFAEKTRIDFYLRSFESNEPPEQILKDVDYSFGPRLISGKILAITDLQAPNLRIVELVIRQGNEPKLRDIVPEDDARINEWLIVGNQIVVSYTRNAETHLHVFDLTGEKRVEIALQADESVRLIASLDETDEMLIEAESFTEPTSIYRCSVKTGKRTLWSKSSVPFTSAGYAQQRVWYRSKDGMNVPMYLVGRREVLESGAHPTIMTSYGGYGLSMTPQFRILVAFLIENGCLFALPNIRGGSEFGAQWHNAAKRRNRQTAYDDFLSAAEWLITSGKTVPERLAIFGGSNSGLLVGAALTQRPDLFRAVVCILPILDMLRYHLFDHGHVWQSEFGTADDPDDFVALANYSPYHRVQDGTAYPATMIVSGDSDQTCNPLHARKMTARLQAANTSLFPIILDYSVFRGHSPMLPLSDRIEGLTNRLSFLCDQLQLPV